MPTLPSLRQQMATLALLNGLAILVEAILIYAHYGYGLAMPPALLLAPIAVGMLGTLALAWRLYRQARQAFDQAATTVQQVAEGRVDLTNPAPCEEADTLMTNLIYMASRFDEDKEAILAAQQRSDQAAQAKSDFLSTMSHEIRTPMNGVLGMAGLLAETKLTSEQQNYLNAIRDSGETLLMVINDILDFSRLEEGRMGIELASFNLTRTVESVSELLSPAAHAKDVEISTYISPQIPTMLRGDVARFRQILTNLIGNAIKFTAQGAVMTEVFLESQGPNTVVLKVQVTDTGIGIEPEASQQIFERFTQADPTISRKFGGTGLGLAICKRLVDIMGGEIGVSSTPDEGSTFYFTLPLQKVTDEDDQEQQLASVAGKRVLVADDHNFNRHIFQRQLEKIGLECTLVADGPAAITALVNAQEREEEPFDLAIIDHIMPNMSGEEVAEYIRVQPQFENLRLILASSKNLSGATPHFKDLGFDYVLTKPVREETLIRAVTNLLAPATEGEPILEETATNALEKGLADLKEIHILLVEDNHMNQLFTTTLLKKHFPNIYTAADGVEALNMAGKIAFDLILMDINMPNMDGLAATKALRALPSFESDTPIIAVTANVEEEEHLKYLRAGMNDVILKPVNKNDLLQAIVRHLSPAKTEKQKKRKRESA